MWITVQDIIEVFAEDEFPAVDKHILRERGRSFVETLLCEVSNLQDSSLRIEAEAIGAI
jgi:hypothetical protein